MAWAKAKKFGSAASLIDDDDDLYLSNIFLLFTHYIYFGELLYDSNPGIC